MLASRRHAAPGRGGARSGLCRGGPVDGFWELGLSALGHRGGHAADHRGRRPASARSTAANTSRAATSSPARPRCTPRWWSCSRRTYRPTCAIDLHSICARVPRSAAPAKTARGHNNYADEEPARGEIHRGTQGRERQRRAAQNAGPGALTAIGIGAIIGAGIFVLTGPPPPNTPGPAIVLSSSSPASAACSRACATPSSPR